MQIPLSNIRLTAPESISHWEPSIQEYYGIFHLTDLAISMYENVMYVTTGTLQNEERHWKILKLNMVKQDGTSLMMKVSETLKCFQVFKKYFFL